MAIRMLVDSTHPEETRVAIVRGNRVEDFDFEAAAKKQLKGNIYLAKVTRVEPSLQAAFVDYGGNRHGFLAFSEIHPDYYQIPVEDREALLAEEAEMAAYDRDHDHDHDDDHDDDDNHDAHDHDHENGDNHEVEAIVSHHDDLSDELLHRPKKLKRRYKIQEVIKRRQVLLIQVVKEERGNKGAALTTYLSLAGRYCVLMPNTLHGGGISRKIANPTDRRKLKSILSDLNMPDGMACIIRTAGLSRTKAEIKRDFDYLERTWDDIRALTMESIAPALIYEEGDLIKRAIRDHYNKDIEEILVDGEEGYKSAKSFMKLLMPSHSKKIKNYKDRVPLFQRFQVEAQLDSMYNPVVQLRSGGYIVINPTEALVSIDVNSGKSTREHNIEETALRTNLEASEEVARQLRLRDMAGLIVIDFIDMEDRNNARNVERKLKDCLKADRARIQVGKISPFGLMEMSRQRLRPGILEASTHSCPQCEGTGIVRSVESSALHALRSLEDEGIRGRSAVVHMFLAGPVALYVLNHKRPQIAEIEARYGFQVFIEVDNTLMAPKFRFERDNTPREMIIDLAIDQPLVIAPDEDDDDDIEDELEDNEVEAEVGAEDDGEAEDDNEAPKEPQAERSREAREGRAETHAEGDERRKRRRRRRRRGRNGENGAEDSTEDHRPQHTVHVEGAEAPEGDEGEDDETEQGEFETQSHEGEDQPRRRRRRGRRGGRRRGRTGDEMTAEGETDSEHRAEPVAAETATVATEAHEPATSEAVTEVAASSVEAVAEEPTAKPKRAPRRKKDAAAKDTAVETVTAEVAAPTAVEVAAPTVDADSAEKPKPRRRAPAKAKKAETEEAAEAPVKAKATKAPAKPKAPAKAKAAKAAPEAQAAAEPVVAEAKPAPATQAKPEPALAPTAEAVVQPAAARHLASAPVEVKDVGDASSDNTRKGWWSRTFGN
ncbi:ribonuclease E/G [Govanella unica]|uniref:Ribonuclease E n=1 Tax=Govanella unica TaxID=2975056 RepID=A0A9X3TXK6_9PROT|nr:Rne/Rng family ribonuclease [Govania unica]MDA5193542.1 Rne/Rng family ribonuclease [Govania unica]